MANKEKAARDNRSNQLNGTNDSFWKSRGFDQRPADWENRDLKKVIPAPKAKTAKKP